MKPQLLDDISGEQTLESINWNRLIPVVLLGVIGLYFDYFFQTQPVQNQAENGAMGIIFLSGSLIGAIIYDLTRRSLKVIYTGLILLALTVLYCLIVAQYNLELYSILHIYLYSLATGLCVAPCITLFLDGTIKALTISLLFSYGMNVCYEIIDLNHRNISHYIPISATLFVVAILCVFLLIFVILNNRNQDFHAPETEGLPLSKSIIVKWSCLLFLLYTASQSALSKIPEGVEEAEYSAYLPYIWIVTTSVTFLILLFFLFIQKKNLIRANRTNRNCDLLRSFTNKLYFHYFRFDS